MCSNWLPSTSMTKLVLFCRKPLICKVEFPIFTFFDQTFHIIIVCVSIYCLVELLQWNITASLLLVDVWCKLIEIISRNNSSFKWTCLQHLMTYYLSFQFVVVHFRDTSVMMWLNNLVSWQWQFWLVLAFESLQ